MREAVKSLTLDQATYWVRNGLMTDEEFKEYCHAWQTGAPRFSVLACRCKDCSRNWYGEGN